MKKKIGIILILTAICYVLAVVVGGFLKENYNHIYNSISELSEVGTGRIFIVELLFNLYNIFLVIYTVLMLFIYSKGLNKIQITVLILLLLCGASGFFMGIFPQESRTAELTIAGIMHFVGAGVAAITTMLATILSWINYKKDDKTKSYAIYSLITFIAIFVSGGSNPILMANGVDSFFGLIERITIGSFIIWLCVTGILQLKGKLLEK